MPKIRGVFDIFKYPSFFIPLLNLAFGLFMIVLFNVFDKIEYQNKLDQELRDQAPEFVKEQSRILVQYTQHSKDLISSISNSENMHAYMTSGNIKELSSLMKTIISAESDLMQLRFIDEQGKETIRFDRDSIDGKIIEVADEDLQDKSHKTYVIENLGQPARIWFSELDLNMEFGEIELPFKPTFRVVLPVWDKNEFRGMLVMNYFASVILSNLFHQSSYYDASLFDEDGYAIYSSKPEHQWTRFQNPPFKPINNSFMLHTQLDTPFANKLFMQLSPKEMMIEQKYNKERKHIKKISIYMSLIVLLITVVLYYTIRQFRVRFENIKAKLELQEQLLEEEKKGDIENRIIDKHVITSTTDIKGRIISVSEAFCNISGYTKEELIGRQHNIVRHPDMPSSLYEELWRTIKSNHVWHGKIKNLRKDGTVYWVDATIESLYDIQGNKIGYSAIRHNITDEMLVIEKEKELIKAHEELRLLNDNLESRVHDQVEQITNQQTILIQQSKMAAMGDMIANIAHQWKQPLSMLSLAILALKKKYDKNTLDDQYMQEFVDKSQKFIHKMNSTIADFSNFFSPNKNKTNFDIYESLYNMRDFFDSMLKKNGITFTIKRHNETEPAVFRGLKNELEQVVLNLMKNSIDAITDNKIDNGFVEIEVLDSPESWMIIFKDNGMGIPKDIIERIFEPYFTTKFKSDGTGIGLYMSKMIVEQTFAGSMTVQNNLDGAIFKIVLPKNLIKI